MLIMYVFGAGVRLTEYSAFPDVQLSERGGSLCVLSINSRGIQVFENVDTIRPKKISSDHPFSIEQSFGFVSTAPLVRDYDLTQWSISRRCQSISTKVSEHTFVRGIWETTIAQHYDRLNRLISESSIGSSLLSLSSLHSTTSLSTMPAAKVGDRSHSNRPTFAVDEEDCTESKCWKKCRFNKDQTK
ncbi:unnamed protein product [Angiostrongylus costaricensis]|uniref:Tyr recombinase domain-containing protein n=1 Tax=Angiostrongylus costaricensis TaxID=334426 RepID=A0A0R3PNQ2_ANGCS|nr:unnamed protein product [Angiostrongylus costaricensis]